ncbi:conserved hypothetical protein [Ricinus communis]|uniref:Uncharacterized protein n=1 Tax=Ricinus communis TaxID=3988 RepID=B9T8X7_RICCO|nr:conserved hypothetical protein [Ricinus communis]
MAKGFRRGNGLIKPSPSSSTASVASRSYGDRSEELRGGNFLLKPGGKISILLGRTFPPRPPSSTCRSGVRSQELAYQGRSFDHSVRSKARLHQALEQRKYALKEKFLIEGLMLRVCFLPEP